MHCNWPHFIWVKEGNNTACGQWSTSQCFDEVFMSQHVTSAYCNLNIDLIIIRLLFCGTMTYKIYLNSELEFGTNYTSAYNKISLKISLNYPLPWNIQLFGFLYFCCVTVAAYVCWIWKYMYHGKYNVVNTVPDELLGSLIGFASL